MLKRFASIFLMLIICGHVRASDPVDVVPTSELTPQIWQYVTAKPADDWIKPGFNSSAWKSGPAPFGQGYKVNTAWTDTPGDIWLRRAVKMPATIPAKLDVLAKHDEDVEIYINGMLAAAANGYTGEYVPLPMSDAARATLKPGETSIIAVHCRQTNGGQVIDVGIATSVFAAPTVVPWHLGGKQVMWKSSTAGHLWQDNPPLTATPGDPKAFADLTADPTQTYQTITAWGGCFNERGWVAMSVLSLTDREKILRALFDWKDGLKLSVGRTPIGASDYAIDPYSLDDTPGDYHMDHFSIDRDRQKLIPFIKAAIAIRPDLKLWAVPWSPPAWMKDNNSMLKGGNIRTDPATMEALALYFEKYVNAYQAEGIDLFMVMPQNEPTQYAEYPSCIWTGQQLRDFIAQNLGPKFKADHVKAEIWLGTLTNSDWSHVAPTIGDPGAMSYLGGIGFQWAGAPAAARVHGLRPTLPLMQSETECGNHENDWNYAENQFRIMKKYLDAGVSSYMLWNMVLDDTGSNWAPSGAGWQQCSPVVVDQKSGQVTYEPQYFMFKHFSSFVEPGARQIDTQGPYGEKIAFRNPNDDVVVIIQNSSDSAIAANVNIGNQHITPKLQPHSWNTFTLMH